MMEKCMALLDFREIDQCIQIHGTFLSFCFPYSYHLSPIDYEGVSLTSRDANSKNAASEATNIFQSHYPEMLVGDIPAEPVLFLTISYSTKNSSLTSPQFLIGFSGRSNRCWLQTPSQR